MFVTAGLLNMLLKHFGTTQDEIGETLDGIDFDWTVLQNPTNRIDANILGRYLGDIVRKTGNARIGLETGFLLPFVLTGSFFNIYGNSKTVREIFERDAPFDPAINDLYTFATKEDRTHFSIEVLADPQFERLYPVASRQWIEMQCGIFLQYAYSFTGRFLHSTLVYSPYGQEGNKDKLEEYLGCPVTFNHDKLILFFDKAVLDLPIITGNKDIYAMFEDYMNEIKIHETQQSNSLSRAVRRFLMHSLLNTGLSLEYVAGRFNMSERNIQRRLKAEGTSYQKILDDLRMELSKKYLREKIPLLEIGLLLGFESQSAFNKFFKKHFGLQPSGFK